MAEGTYEYECMRAELLGVDKPNQEEFEEKMRLQRAAEEEEHITEQMKEVDLRDEQLQGTGSKLDELNRMFMTTQHRMAKFKNVYGSLKGLLKSRPDTPSEECSLHESPNGADSNAALDTLDTMKDVEDLSDVNTAESAASELHKIGSMIHKADNAIKRTEE